jgi:hypothetical protein
MAASVEPQTPEEDAVLRALAATHRRRHRWFALFWSVAVSGHVTVILHTIWHEWPLDTRGLGRLAFVVVNALGALGMCAWGLRGLRADEAMARQWKVEDVRWRAQRRAWHQPWAASRRPPGEGAAR